MPKFTSSTAPRKPKRRRHPTSGGVVSERDCIVPSDWTIEAVPPHHALVRSPDGMMATLDFDKRGWRAGYTTTSRIESQGTYGGRGWKQALCAAAVRWLDNLRNS